MRDSIPSNWQFQYPNWATKPSTPCTPYQTYVTNLELSIELEENAIAKQNLDITLDKFLYWNNNHLRFRTAQLWTVECHSTIQQRTISGKLSEIALHEISWNINFKFPHLIQQQRILIFFQLIVITCRIHYNISSLKFITSQVSHITRYKHFL
jgi:hypothetical protein